MKNIIFKRRRLFTIAITVLLCSILQANTIENERIAKRDSILKQITGAVISEKVLNITSFGAKGNGIKDCKPAFDKAMKRAKHIGGARIVIPAGEYLLNGPIHFVSNVCLELQEGATLKFSPNPEYYLPIVKSSWEGTFLQNYSPFIYGYGVENVSIVGKGVIDGNASTTFATWKSKQRDGQQLSRRMNHEQTPIEGRKFGEGHYLRPHLVQFFDCKNITLEGVFITNAPFWCVHLLKCENVICDGLRYDAKLVNNDGIDPEYTRNVLIQNIEFNNGDDNVAIKAGRDHDGRKTNQPSGNIIIRNCKFKGLHGVVLGSEMSSGIENVFVEDCTYAGYCKRGLYIKTNPDRGGFIRDIYFNNCEFGEVEDLFFITAMYAGEGKGNHFFTDVNNIHVKNVKCKKVRNNAIVLQGTQALPLREITFENVNVDEAKVGICMENTEAITLKNCNLGGYVVVPTTASNKDNIFDENTTQPGPKRPRKKFNSTSPNVHDPIMAQEDGKYYMFATGMGINMFSSTDMKTWSLEKNVLNPIPAWVKELVPGYKGHTWAPDIIHVGNRWFLYYSCSTFGKNTSAIGLASTPTLNPQSPLYKWTDHGLVIRSQAGKNDWNAIDPAVIMDKEGCPWLSYGSFWDGIQLVSLKTDMKTPKGIPTTIARRYNLKNNPQEKTNPIEAPFIVHHEGYYYLFVSFDYCCKGLESNYKVAVGRSKDIEGPYLDKEGKKMLDGGGTIILQGNERYSGIGHCAVYEFDGKWYIIAHGYDKQVDGSSNLFLHELRWEFGWPKVIY